MIPRSIIFEMETGDPDDIWTLAWLATSPRVHLQAVVVTPGGPDQIQLARYVLARCGAADTPIGALHGPNWDDGKRRVGGWYSKAYPDWVHADSSAEAGPALVADFSGPHTTLLAGAPPKNFAEAAKCANFKPGRWVQQGGFAGKSLVARPLAKFAERETCASFNVGGAPQQVFELVNAPFSERLFVSKNVCHGVVWDAAMHAALHPHLPPVVQEGLALYDFERPKALHDLVAAAVAVEPAVCTFTGPAELYRVRGEWGTRLASAGPVRVSVGFDRERFIRTLTA